MPAEWAKHLGTLIAWPTNPETWEGTEKEIRSAIAGLAAEITLHEELYITIKTSDSKEEIIDYLRKNNAMMERVTLLDIPNNDSWTRDYGPNYVCREENGGAEWAINRWGYNAWGGKYPPWTQDNDFKSAFAEWIGCPELREPGMILEGGSIDVNGEGIVLTTKSCLLNPNRNPALSQPEIEKRLKKYLGVEDIIWIEEGIAGDDTDGHIDDFVRFIDTRNIVCCYEENRQEENFKALDEAYNTLLHHPVLKNRGISVHKLPMPGPKYFRDFRIPASYANFYFVNGGLLVPIFNDPMDEKVIGFLQSFRPDLKVKGIPGLDFVRGLGGIHCLTQQIYG